MPEHNEMLTRRMRASDGFFYCSIFRIKRAGLPAHISFLGMFLVTTQPAAIIDLLPIVTPFKIIECAPIKAFFLLKFLFICHYLYTNIQV